MAREQASVHTRRDIIATAVLAMGGTLFGGAYHFQEEEKPMADESLTDRRTRNKTVKSILEDRKTTIKKLLVLFDPKNAAQYDEDTRAAAAYLLGELRSEEAILFLVEALDDEPRGADALDISPYDMPVTRALTKIGRPAVPELIKKIQMSDHPVGRNKAIQVLKKTLGGKRRLLDVLTKVEQQTQKESIHRVRDAIEYVKTNVKEEGEPLF